MAKVSVIMGVYNCADTLVVRAELGRHGRERVPQKFYKVLYCQRNIEQSLCALRNA